jgi:predicted ATP-dependent protease
MPKKNLKDLDEIPEDVRNELTIIPVSHMDEVIQHALLEKPAPGDIIKYAHFDAILMPGLEGGWQSPPPPPVTAASG